MRSSSCSPLPTLWPRPSLAERRPGGWRPFLCSDRASRRLRRFSDPRLGDLPDSCGWPRRRPIASARDSSRGRNGFYGVDWNADLKVIDESAVSFRVAVLAVSGSVDAVVAQAQRYRPEIVVIADESKASGVAAQLPRGTELMCGPRRWRTVARRPRWW